MASDVMIFICVILILFISLSSVTSELQEEMAWHWRLRRQGLILVLGLPSDCPQTAPGQVLQRRQVAEGGAFGPGCHLLALWALAQWWNFSRPQFPCVWNSGHHNSSLTGVWGMKWGQHVNHFEQCLVLSKPFIDVLHAEGAFEDPFSAWLVTEYRVSYHIL